MRIRSKGQIQEKQKNKPVDFSLPSSDSHKMLEITGRGGCGDL